MTLELAVFDVAGTTVLDEGGLVAEALERAFRRYRLRVDPALIHACMGIGKTAAIQRVLRETLGPSTMIHPRLVEAIHEAFAEGLEETYRTYASAVPGAEESMAILKAVGVKVALTSGFMRRTLDAVLGRLGWVERGLVDVTVASDEVLISRPGPAMIFRAMSQTRVAAPAHVAKVGDTPADLWEGANAGAAWIVGVTWGSYDRAGLGQHPHTHLADRWEDVLRALTTPPTPRRDHAAAEASPGLRAVVTEVLQHPAS